MAKKITEEDLRLNIIINGDNGRKQILDLDSAVQKSTDSLKKLKADMAAMEAQGKTTGKAYGQLKTSIEKETKSLDTNRQKLDALRRQQSITTMTIGELRKHINLTRTALANAVPDTENWEKLNGELRESRTRLKELEDQAKATEGVTGSMTEGWSDVWSLKNIISEIGETIKDFVINATDAYQEYDEALTDAMKTTNLTKEEVAAMGEEFKKLDTRTAQNELMSLLRIGGKLGITGQEDLMGFVKAADKINVALSEDLGGSAEEAIAAIGKMTDIFDLASEYGQENAMLKIASAVNSLGMASTANEGYVVDFTKRMAGIAPSADISIDKVLGLAATLDKYGQTSEVSATSIGQTIVAMYKKTETFAEIAKMSFGEFKQLLDTDMNEALLRVVEGMKGAADDGFAPIVSAMDGMGLNGQRAVTVLGTLAKNSEEVRAQQALANQAFTEGTSVIDEFNTKNESVTASMEKYRNAIHNSTVEIGQQLMPVVQGTMDIASVGMGLLSKLVALIVQYKGIILALTVAYGALKVAKLADIAVDKVRHFWSKRNRADLALEATMLEGSRKRTIAAALAKNLLCGNLKAAGIAFKTFATSIKTGLGPIGWVILAIEGLLALFSPLMKIWNDQRQLNKQIEESNKKLSASFSDVTMEIEKEKSRLSQMETAVLKAKTGSQERAAAIRQINSAYRAYLPKLLTEKSSNTEVATALAAVNTQLERKIKLQAREKALSEVNENVDNQTKEVMTGFVDMLEKSIGKETSAAARSQMNAAVIEYRRAYEAATTKAQKYTARHNLFSTYFELGGNQAYFRGDKLRNYVTGLNKVIDSGKRATETINQLYGAGDGVISGSGTTTTIDGDTVTSDGSGAGSGTGSGSQKWSLNNDEAHLQAVLALKKKFAAGQIATEEELNAQILQLEIETLQKRLAIAEGDELLSVDRQLQDKLIQQKRQQQKEEEDARKERERTEEEAEKTRNEIMEGYASDRFKSAVKAENERYAKELALFKGNAAGEEAALRAHNARLAKIRMEQIDAEVESVEDTHSLNLSQLQLAHSKELAAFRGNARELRQLKQRHARELADENGRYIAELSSMLSKLAGTEYSVEVSSDDPSFTAVRQKLLELQQHLSNLTGTVSVDYSSDGGSSDKWAGKQDMQIFGTSVKNLGEMFQKMKEGTMDGEAWGTLISGIGGAAQYACDVAAKAIDVVNAKEKKALDEYKKNQDKKKEALQKRVDAGLMTEEQYNAEVAAMDAEREAKEEELAIKQAKRQKALSLAQAIINTAMSVTMAIATLPPPASYIMAALNAAMGAAEIALIAAQPISTGYEQGGLTDVKRRQDGRVFRAHVSTDRGMIGQPTVLVGENGSEYVIPHEGLENPSLAPFISTMETARRNGTLKSLDFNAMYSPTYTLPGRSSGGYTDHTGATGAIGSISSGNEVADAELTAILKKLSAQLETPIRAEVSMLGSKGIVKKTEEYNRMRNRGRL